MLARSSRERRQPSSLNDLAPRAAVVAVGEGVHADYDAADGAQVSRENAGDNLFGQAGVEAERCGAPDVAPPAGECLCAAGVLGWQEGHDSAEQLVWELADEIVVIFRHVRGVIVGAGKEYRWSVF